VLEAYCCDSLEGKKNKDLAISVYRKGLNALKKMRGSTDKTVLEASSKGSKKRGRPSKSDNSSYNCHADSSSWNSSDQNYERVNKECSQMKIAKAERSLAMKHSKNNQKNDNEDDGGNYDSNKRANDNDSENIDSDKSNINNYDTNGNDSGSRNNDTCDKSNVDIHPSITSISIDNNQHSACNTSNQPNSAEKSAMLLESINQRKLLNKQNKLINHTSNSRSLREVSSSSSSAIIENDLVDDKDKCYEKISDDESIGEYDHKNKGDIDGNTDDNNNRNNGNNNNNNINNGNNDSNDNNNYDGNNDDNNNNDNNDDNNHNSHNYDDNHYNDHNNDNYSNKTNSNKTNSNNFATSSNTSAQQGKDNLKDF
jgi:hypothetical protein